VTITVPGGKMLSGQQRETLERAAATCPVKQSLHPEVKIVTEFSYE
jgi:uncharacterized OsmC-like protein